LLPDPIRARKQNEPSPGGQTKNLIFVNPGEDEWLLPLTENTPEEEREKSQRGKTVPSLGMWGQSSRMPKGGLSGKELKEIGTRL